MIKLKDIILEIKKGTKLPVFAISKIEELEALNSIKNVILPKNLERWKQYGSKETIESVRQKLKKIKIYKRQGIVRAMMYSTNDGPWWLIRKDRKGQLEIIGNNGQAYLRDGTEKWKADRPLDHKDMDYLHPDDGIDEAKETPIHLQVTRKEEHEAVAFIKRVAIPYAVENWNKSSPRHWQLKVEDAVRLLKKVGVSNGKGGDMVIYKVQFKVPGTSAHEFVFTIFKSDLVNKLSVQMELNLHKAGDYTFDVTQSS